MAEILSCGSGAAESGRVLHCCKEQRSHARATFRRKMEMAGIKTRDRIAIAVSGGADSMALCLLALEWTESKDLLLGMTVDHGFRPESADEVLQVHNWLQALGMDCEILKCSWPEGMPSPGHLQEKARKARYDLLQDACQRNGVGVLLTAHHADDQAELFVLRLSRCSGDNGLACMPLCSELFPTVPSTKIIKVLLVRPLLDLQKSDLYNVCSVVGQQWIEDPTNQKAIYARNRIRKEFSAVSDSMRNEIQDLISTYRRKREELYARTNELLSEFMHIDKDYGYVVVDAEGLLAETHDTEVHESILTAVLRFVAQRPKPPKGTAVRKAKAWLLNRATEGRVTLAGCSLCLQPRTRGSKVLVTYSPDSPRSGFTNSRQNNQTSSSLKSGNVTRSKYSDVIMQARQSRIISESTATFLSDLAGKMAADMVPVIKEEVEANVKVGSHQPDGSILFPKETKYYTERYIISWWQQSDTQDCKRCLDGSCSLRVTEFARIRHFSKNDLLEIRQHAFSDGSLRKEMHEAWLKLKSLPENVRRGLPVLITESNELISVPSVGFRNCPNTRTSIKFCPKVPLDGGYALWS